MRRPLSALVGALLVVGSLTGLAVAAPVETVVGPAAGPPGGLLPAERITGIVDVVSVYNRANALTPGVQAAAIAAAGDSGAAYALGRGATIGLRSVRRGATTVKFAPGTFQFPVSVTALPVNAIGPTMGGDVSATVGNGQVVMSATSAMLNNAQAGDVVDLVADNGSIRSYTIGLIAPDAVVGGTELVVTPAMADELGMVIETRVLLWGFASRGALETAIAANGLTTRTDTRVRKSWDAPDPDSTLGLASTKVLLGEFSYSVSSTDAVTQSADWPAAFLPPGRELLSPQIPIRARCNLQITADLSAALAEVAAAGLGGAIDVANANTYGGCFNPRFNRLGVAIGSLSRHAWGGALDTNTTTNAQGATPQMNCSVVRIFRKHNFAWGGNFLTPDGMHFEWVGTRRDQLPYPSRFCPNLASATGAFTAEGEPAGTVDAAAVPTARDTMFVDDAWAGE